MSLPQLGCRVLLRADTGWSMASVLYIHHTLPASQLSLSLHSLTGMRLVLVFFLLWISPANLLCLSAKPEEPQKKWHMYVIYLSFQTVYSNFIVV